MLVGNFPRYVGRRHDRKSDQAPIRCEKIDPFLFEEDETCTVTQAEFSFLNTIYVYALIRRQHNQSISHTFKVYSLVSRGMEAVQQYNLHDLVERNKYGRFNRGLEFVSFAQCAPLAQDLNTLDVLSIHFLTGCGDVYLLNPVIMETMIFREDQFSQMISSLQELVNEDPEDKLVKKLRIALI